MAVPFWSYLIKYLTFDLLSDAREAMTKQRLWPQSLSSPSESIIVIFAYDRYQRATALCYYFNAHLFWFSFLKSWSGWGHLTSVRAPSIRASHAARSMRRRSQLSAACHPLSVDLSFISPSSRHSRYAASSCLCCSSSFIFGFRHNSSLELVCSWSLRPASIDPALLPSRLLLAPINSLPVQDAVRAHYAPPQQRPSDIHDLFVIRIER